MTYDLASSTDVIALWTTGLDLLKAVLSSTIGTTILISAGLIGLGYAWSKMRKHITGRRVKF